MSVPLRHGVCMLAIFVALATGISVNVEADEDAAGSGSAAEEKLKERIVVLAEIVRLERESYQQSETTLTSVLLAQAEYIKAVLEVTSDPRKRIELLQENLQAYQQIEQTTETMVEEQAASKIDLLKARAARLRAEADLLTAREQLNRR